MITEKSREAYAESGLDGNVVIYIPNMQVVAFGDDEAYIIPDEDTDKTFLDRIVRSQKAGRNLFREELERFEVKPGVFY